MCVGRRWNWVQLQEGVFPDAVSHRYISKCKVCAVKKKEEITAVTVLSESLRVCAFMMTHLFYFCHQELGEARACVVS